MKKISLLLLFCLMIAVSVSPQALSERKMKKIQDEVEAVFLENLKTGESLNIEQLANSVDDSPNAGHIVNGVFFTSIGPILQRSRDGMQGLNSLRYEIKNQRITVLSENTAIVAASGYANSESASGQKFTTGFAWTFVYRKSWDQWKVIHSHQSNPR